MSLKRRNVSLAVNKANTRLEGMLKIDKKYKQLVEYGGMKDQLNSKEILKQINECKSLMKEYNKILDLADAKSLEIKKAELKLLSLNSRVLSGGKSKFGNKSIELKTLNK